MNRKQTKLTAFLAKKSNETSSTSSPSRKKNCKINMNVFVNLKLKSRFGKKDSKTICFVSAIPDNRTSSIPSESQSHSSTSEQTATERENIDSAAVNVNVTLNVTADMGGK